VAVKAGALRRRLAFQAQSSTQDASGQPLDTWATSFTVWGSLLDVSAREAVNGAYTAQITTVATIRYRTGVLAGMRISGDGRYLEIVAPPIDKGGRHEQLEIMCREITP
jgi:SPP1 family predicted phage head-tail adaptor